MEITIERLRRFIDLRENKEEIMQELDALYYPITSPKFGELSGMQPGDPTARAVDKILRLQERLQEKTQAIAEELQEIEDWLDTVEDDKLEKIIRAHYLQGVTWNRCTQRFLSYTSEEGAKKYVYNWFRKNGPKIPDKT